MKSTANIKGHPIHPILVGFPIAFFTAALLFDAVAFFYKNDTFWLMGKYMVIAGIVSAIITAIPGIIDYFFTVPPKSSAKKRGAQHGILNTTMLILFVVAYFIRQKQISFSPIIFEFIGFVTMIIAGWLGGTLVYRNQIGVDPRYANAGKWKEAYINQSGNEFEVAEITELEINQMKLLHINNERIVLGRTESGYVAFNDRCSHKGGSLAGGAMICGTVQCPWHGSQFDCSTGAVKAGPAKDGIDVYGIIEKDGKVYLKLAR
jgi:uncharacterized membrane protein/nitrite reductase/ring-hydroxylating ferredoxin subunit